MGVQDVLASPPPEGAVPCINLRYHPGPLLSLGRGNPGYYTRGALAKWRLREYSQLCVRYEHREYYPVPVRSRAGLYPAVPDWWTSLHIPRGMGCRLPDFCLLQKSLLLRAPYGARENAMAATTWVVEVADVFLSSLLTHGHLWLMGEPLLNALASLDSSVLFLDKEKERAGLYDEALSLLRRITNLVPEDRLKDGAEHRGLVVVNRELSTEEWKLHLLEGLGIDTLP